MILVKPFVVTAVIGLLTLFVAPDMAYSQGKSVTAAKTRIENVRKLVEQSSGAKQIAASSNSSAMDLQAQAQSQLQLAQQAIDEGNMEQAQSLLDDATGTMFKAIRASGEPAVVVEKQIRDYSDRLASITALLQAYERVRVEKELKQSSTIPQIREKLVWADELYNKKEYQAGRKMLDDAYVLTKFELEKLRGGDTLVRTLNFSSKQDEYEYELDRNDTHKMLISVLLADKMKDKRVAKMSAGFIEKADVLRVRALAEAQKGDYGIAIKTLEESTKNLVRAIRGAGIYIPG